MQNSYLLAVVRTRLSALQAPGEQTRARKNPPQFTIVPDAVAARQTPTTARAATAIKAPRPNTALHLQNSAISSVAASASRDTPAEAEGAASAARIAVPQRQKTHGQRHNDGQPHQKQSAP